MLAAGSPGDGTLHFEDGAAGGGLFAASMAPLRAVVALAAAPALPEDFQALYGAAGVPDAVARALVAEFVQGAGLCCLVAVNEQALHPWTRATLAEAAARAGCHLCGPDSSPALARRARVPQSAASAHPSVHNACRCQAAGTSPMSQHPSSQAGCADACASMPS